MPATNEGADALKGLIRRLQAAKLRRRQLVAGVDGEIAALEEAIFAVAGGIAVASVSTPAAPAARVAPAGPVEGAGLAISGEPMPQFHTTKDYLLWVLGRTQLIDFGACAVDVYGKDDRKSRKGIRLALDYLRRIGKVENKGYRVWVVRQGGRRRTKRPRN